MRSGRCSLLERGYPAYISKHRAMATKLTSILTPETTATDNAKGTISATKIKYIYFNLIHPQNQDFTMQKSILNLTLSIGLLTLGFTQTAFAGQQTTTHTGPNGNTITTKRSYDDGQQTTTHTGPNGNTITIDRRYDNGKLKTTLTGPNGNTIKIDRRYDNGQLKTTRTGINGNNQMTNRSIYR
jgi:hypothetical protein